MAAIPHKQPLTLGKVIRMNKTAKAILLGLLAVVILHIPVMTEIRVQRAKWLLSHSTSFDVIIEKYGKPQLVEDHKSRKGLLRDTDIEITKEQKLWLIPKEGISYWNILIVTDEENKFVIGAVDRL